MTKFSFGKKKYRVTSNFKFALSAFLTVLLIVAVLGIGGSVVYNGVAHATSEKAQLVHEAELNAAKQKYSFTYNGTYIEAISADDALAKTKKLLNEKTREAEELKNINKTQTNQLKYKNEIIISQVQSISVLRTKYDQKTKEIDTAKKEEAAKLAAAKEEKEKSNSNLYKQYSYAIEYPGSDMTVDDIKMIVDIANEENVNPHLWLSLVQLESNYKSTAKSKSSSASGWGQVIRGTGKYLYEDELKLGKYNHATMGINKEINARMSIHYLSDLIQRSGSVEKALINYNGGELGVKYANIIKNNLAKNTGMTLASLN